ncbi:MAG: hypothetical protein ACLFOY_17180 [Desulfatibacillaceae bacterium]
MDHSGSSVGPHPCHVEVIPLGVVDSVAVSVAAANIQAVLGMPADVAAPWPDPVHAVIPARRQYNALVLLRDLDNGTPAEGLRLGLLDKDLCVPVFSYVLGEARLGGRAAVVSLHRLRAGAHGRSADRSLMYERLAKVALHETAHLLGREHCREPGCLMGFSARVDHLDRLSSFCDACSHYLRATVART